MTKFTKVLVVSAVVIGGLVVPVSVASASETIPWKVRTSQR